MKITKLTIVAMSILSLNANGQVRNDGKGNAGTKADAQLVFPTSTTSNAPQVDLSAPHPIPNMKQVAAVGIPTVVGNNDDQANTNRAVTPVMEQTRTAPKTTN